MATVSKAIADQIIANDGYYPGDPRVKMVIEYNNQFNGEVAYAIIYPHDDPLRTIDSPAVINPRIIWQAQKDRGMDR